MATTRVSGPADPVTTTGDVVFTKRITFRATGATGTITDVQLTSVLPLVGSYTYRLVKLSFYAAADATSFVELVDEKTDQATFVDYGTQGSIRPQVHIRPSWQLRNQWFEKGTAETFYTWRTHAAQPASNAVVQATLEVRLSAPLPV